MSSHLHLKRCRFPAHTAKILEGRLQLRVEFGEKKILEVVEAAKKNNIEILSVGLHKPTIDDVFLHYTGKTIREETLSGKDQMRMRKKAWGHKR